MGTTPRRKEVVVVGESMLAGPGTQRRFATHGSTRSFSLDADVPPAGRGADSSQRHGDHLRRGRHVRLPSPHGIVAILGATSALAGCSPNIAGAPAGATSGAPRSNGGRAANGLAYSYASAEKVQEMPPAGSCHYRGRGLYALPDARCSPGALNPVVRQASIGRTICRPGGYTRSVRPPESVTEPEKRADMGAYGDHNRLSRFELDHVVPLSLGGAANDRRNFFPEVDYRRSQDGGYLLNPKDRVEKVLARDVCTGRVPLAAAQRAIATNWTTALQKLRLAQ